MNRALRLTEKVVDYLVMLYFLVFILVGAYTVYDSALVYLEASDVSDIQRVKPLYAGGQGGSVDKDLLEDKLVGWLTIDGTSIDYPVMQGDDNREFLTKDPFGAYSITGSIFLDYRNSRDFSDPYSMIYGHHMSGGAMFGALDDYLKKGYFEEHRDGTLSTEDRKYDIRLFAVLDILGTEEAVFSPTENDSEVLDYIKEHSLFLDESGFPKKDEKLVALSTCKSLNTGYRTVVVGTLS